MTADDPPQIKIRDRIVRADRAPREVYAHVRKKNVSSSDSEAFLLSGLDSLCHRIWHCAEPKRLKSPGVQESQRAGEQRVQDLLGRMTLQEKVAMLSGADWMQSVPNERLGIPSIKMADGPLGIRSWAGPSAETSAATAKTKVMTTAFPAGVAMAATWDTELVQAEGQAIGQEVKALGRDMILGPTVNINRTPLWGEISKASAKIHILRAAWEWLTSGEFRAKA